MKKAEERFARMANGCEHTKRVLLQDFAEDFWTPWLYNQAVGWLRVYVYPRETKYGSPCVSGEYFAIDAKRLSKDLKRKRFLWAGEAFAIAFEEGTESHCVFDRVSQEIQQWAQSERIRKVTLDLNVWENIGPHIDWAAILWSRSADNDVNEP